MAGDAAKVVECLPSVPGNLDKEAWWHVSAIKTNRFFFYYFIIPTSCEIGPNFKGFLLAFLPSFLPYFFMCVWALKFFILMLFEAGSCHVVLAGLVLAT